MKKYVIYRTPIFSRKYDNLSAVYIITLSGKKDQQKVINTINYFLEKYREDIKELTDKEDSI